jgi:hypothetical protein
MARRGLPVAPWWLRAAARSRDLLGQDDAGRQMRSVIFQRGHRNDDDGVTRGQCFDPRCLERVPSRVALVRSWVDFDFAYALRFVDE